MVGVVSYTCGVV